ncbi:MAG: extracellular solute-binding protein [Anaerolineales bacterium]|jgi:arabinogalactan oligomer/maltooligosaccharide transport system substrate-binding protein
MMKKIWFVLSFLLVVALVLSACGPSETPTEEPVVTEEPMETEEPEEKMEPEEEEMMTLEGTITLWHALKESEAPGLNAAIESFQAEYPDVTFDVLYVPDTDLRGKYETAAATGGGPSLMLGFQDWGPALYEAELVADLGDLASLDFLQTINQAALGSVRYEGALVGMPFGLKGVVMYRNTSIVPEAATSFEDLVSKAQAATEGDVLGANLEYGHFFAFAHLNALGGQLMNEAGDPLFNDDKGVEWLNLLNSFKDAGPVEWYTDNDVNLFKAGQVGVIIDGTWNLSGIAEEIGEDNLAIDPWPAGMSGYVQNDNLYMSANVEGADKDATWAFMQYLESPDIQAMIAEENTGFIPNVAGVDVPDRLRQEAVAAFEGGVAFPVIPEMGAYWGPMETAIRSVVDEGADPEFALGQAYNAINAAVAEIRGEEPPEAEVLGTVTLWHALKESEAPGLNAAIEAFQESNPGVLFDVLYVPDTDLRGKYETAAATGGGPTLMLGFQDWGPALYEAELVADVSDMASTVFLSTINQAALGSVQYEGAIVGLPFGLKGVVMYRNASIIPEAATSFEDLVSKAQAATEGDVLGANLEYGHFFAFAHLNAVGGQLMDEAGDPLFNDENGVEWLNLLNSFKDAGPVEWYTDNDVNLFKAGQVGVIIDGTWNLSGIVEVLDEEIVSIDPWPADMSGYVQNDNLYLSANAEGDDKAATWAFMQYLESPDAQKMIAENNTGFIPNVAGVEVPDRLRQEAVVAFEGGVAFPVIPEMGAYWGPMETAIRSVVDEGADPAETLQTAFDAIVPAIAEIRGE